MKKIITPLLVFFGLLVSAFSNPLSAQTTAAIATHYEYVSQPCSVPTQWYFYFSAETNNYSSLDSAAFFIDFGDGNDTTVMRPLNFYNAAQANSSLVNYMQHTYTAAGNYAVVYILTMPDGNADTANVVAMVNNTCNNVTGRLYVDVNSDCTYNGGDIPIASYQMELLYNSCRVATGYTDGQGLFIMSALPGYTYQLGVYAAYSAIPNFICGTSQYMSINVSPSATQDLIASNTSAINITYAGDSAAFNSGNCVPFTTYLYINGATLGYTPLTDSADIYVNFGDGNDTLITSQLNGNNFYSTFYAGVSHTYTSAGSYDVLYIATGPDGNADTLIHYNEIVVSNTCGNVEGDVYIDNNNNCVFDAGDSSSVYIWVSLTTVPSGASYYAFTDAAGHYEFSVPPGNYSVSVLPSLNYVPLTPTCPSSGMTAVTVIASNTVQASFAVVCPSSFDLTGHFIVTHGIFPTSSGRIYPYIHNMSCTAIAGSVTLILDPLVNYVGVCDPNFAPTVNGDTLTWTFANANSYLNWYYWYSYQGCIKVIGDPALQIGDSVCITMIVDPIAGDVNPANNTFTLCIPALVSLDPNAKDVLPRGQGPQGYVAQHTTFDYSIQFQNTGTTAARDIFILDSLDADLDLSTLVITGSSHFMQPQILPGNVLKFNFQDIWLADSTSDESHSHGWVTYRITAKPALAPLTQIRNKAGIYFDFNAPVMTNSTLNTITDPSSVNEISAIEATIFPNPASSTVTVLLSKESNAVYTLTDLAGKVVLTGKMQGRSATISVNELPQGVYLLNVATAEGSSVHKVMVQH